MLSENNISNRLIHEKSPYLLQHANNPVNWYPWGDEAFEEARRRGVPVFLSIGYSSCHWCHVMERECFEDREVADKLNANFVSVKVDREERPDVDHLYMEACAALTGGGGWPLSCFARHDRRPFFAGTYFPKHDRAGLPGFMTVLDNISSLWKHDRQRLERAAESLVGHMSERVVLEKGTLGGVCEAAYGQLERSFDSRYGGFGTQPKFPSAHNLLFLLRYGLIYRDSRAHEMVRKTLDGMAAGGIFDHIGGGFCRYSTDARWLVPHFEKMLYDNAMLAMAYAEAAAAFVRADYEAVARRVFEYCARDMLGADGGFFTAEDADSEGVEGKYYLWTPGEVIKALGGGEGERFCQLFHITEPGNFEGKSIPNLIGRQLSHEEKNFAAQCFPKLLSERAKRVPPFKDDKTPAAGNGLMVASLALAGRLLREQAFIRQAECTARFMLGSLVQGGRLMSGRREGVAAHPATSDDYAYLVWGLVELHQATHNPDWLELAAQWADSMLALFRDDEDGALFLSGGDVHDLPLRQKNTHDGALPSGNSVAALNLLRLARLTGREEYEARAEAILDALAGMAEAYPAGLTALLMSKLYMENLGTEVMIASGKGLDEMLQAAEGYLPFTTVSVRGMGYEKMDALAPSFQPMDALYDTATAYLCSKGACQQPVTEPGALREKLRGVY